MIILVSDFLKILRFLCFNVFIAPIKTKKIFKKDKIINVIITK